MTTDPGSVPKNAVPLCNDDVESNNGPRYCRPVALSSLRKRDVCSRCVAFKPERAHHCSICNRCVVKMDHHCPWVNNCVGIGNQKFFLQFLLWIFTSSIYALVLNSWHFVKCMSFSESESSEPCYNTIRVVLMLTFLFCESLLFGMFTCCMMAEQLSGLYSNMNHIDRLKRIDPTNVGLKSYSGINEIFGGDKNVWCHWRWLTWSPVQFPSSMRSEIYGYEICYDEERSIDDHSNGRGAVESSFHEAVFGNSEVGTRNEAIPKSIATSLEDSSVPVAAATVGIATDSVLVNDSNLVPGGGFQMRKRFPVGDSSNTSSQLSSGAVGSSGSCTGASASLNSNGGGGALIV